MKKSVVLVIALSAWLAGTTALAGEARAEFHAIRGLSPRLTAMSEEQLAMVEGGISGSGFFLAFVSAVLAFVDSVEEFCKDNPQCTMVTVIDGEVKVSGPGRVEVTHDEGGNTTVLVTQSAP